MPRLFLSALLGLAVAMFAGARSTLQQPTAGNQSPASTNQSPTTPATNQSPGQPQDPAAVLFTTEAGLVLHAIKPGSVADYESAILALKEALAKAEDGETRTLAAGWRIYKASEADAKGSVIYVHLLDPAVPGVDYRPSLWLDKLLAGAPADLLAKYRDSFAVPPAKLSLSELKKP